MGQKLLFIAIIITFLYNLSATYFRFNERVIVGYYCTLNSVINIDKIIIINVVTQYEICVALKYVSEILFKRKMTTLYKKCSVV